MPATTKPAVASPEVTQDPVFALLAGDPAAVMTFLEVATILDRLPATPAEAGGRYRALDADIAAAEAAIDPLQSRLDALRGLASALASELAEVPDLASASDAEWSRRAGLLTRLAAVDAEVPRAMNARHLAHDEVSGLERAQNHVWIGAMTNARSAIEFKLANKLPVRRSDVLGGAAGVLDLPDTVTARGDHA